MATTINSYSIKLGMDAAGFIDSTKLSRSEARGLIKEIEGAQTPLEKFAVQQARWKKQLDDGIISQGVYNRLIEAHKPKIEAAASSLSAYGAAAGIVAGGLTAAGIAAVAFVGHMRGVQNEIDDAADSAGRLGVTFADLKTLEFAFKEGGGVDAQTVADSIKKMQINLAKAVDGDKNLREAFAKLGLDAGELIGQGPREAIWSISDAMASVGTHAERLKLSMEIFGKSGADLASTLGMGTDALAGSVAFADQWLGLTEQQVAMVGANNDAWDRVDIVVTGLTQKLAAELAPAMNIIAENVLGVADGFENVDQYIRNAVSNAVVMAGVAKDIAEYLALIGGAAAPGLMRFGDAEFDTGVKWFQQLEAKRAEMLEASRDAAGKREEQRQTLLMKEIEDKEKTREDQKEKRKLEAVEKEEHHRAELAFKAAEKHFEDERKRQQKLREEAAKGPETFEVGSAGFAKLLADQANMAMAQTKVASPTDAELLAEFKKQSAEAQAHTAKMEAMIAELRNVKQAVSDNTIVRAR